MRIAVDHITRYSYGSEATYSIQSLRMTPADFAGQRTIDWRIESSPASATSTSHDAFGNLMHLMTINQPHREIEIRVRGLVDVEDRQGVVQGAPEPAPLRVFLRRTPLTAPGAEIQELVYRIGEDDRISLLHALMGHIRDHVDYMPGVTHAETPAAQAYAARRGVCQDHAHIFIGAARAADIPARYVTGYLLLDGDDRAEAHHAWAEAYVEGLGWIGFDVANRICPTDRYVRMAVGLDAHSATPIRGSRRGGGEERLAVEVNVAREMSQQ